MVSYENVVHAWNSWNIKTAEELSRCLNVSHVQCLTESNNIDSETVDLNVAREVMIFGTVHQYTGSLLVLTELSNASMCHKLMCKRFEERAPLSLDFIREIHSTMMAGCYDKHRYVELEERPGAFKKHDFIVGKDEVGVDPEDVEEELQILLTELKDFQEKEDLSGSNVLWAGAYFHAKFECIHPFADGNGRVGRLLLNYWLVSNNHPPVTIFSEDKERYYTALQEYVDQEDLAPLVRFLEEQTAKTWPVYR